MIDDAELLRRYVDSRSEMDFTVLVERHLNLVYQAALRRTGGRSDLAQDVTQQVFTTLACEASKLVAHPALVGWLFTATRHAAIHLLRTERRRQEREMQALMRNSLENSEPEANWDQVRNQLDEVMDQLSEQDRTVILMRFFRNQAFAQVGEAVGLNEDTARKRVDRALDRLRGLLAKRGITSTSSALGVMLASQAATAAPAGLSQTIAGVALSSGAAASLPTSGLLYLMNTKLALGIAGTLGLAALFTLPPAGLAIFEGIQASNAEKELTAVRDDNARHSAELANLQTQILAAEQNAATVKLEQERARAATAAATSTPVRPARTPVEIEALKDGKEFLARFPQAGPMLLELGRAQIHSNHRGFYRSANLTPAQIDEFEKQTAEYWLQNQGIGPKGMSPVVSQLPDSQLQQILGEENFQHFQDFVRKESAYQTARWAATCAGFENTPLTQEQSDLFAQSIVANSGEYQDGQLLKPENVNWRAVREQVEKTLTPEQWKAVQPALLAAQYQNAVAKAQQEAAISANPQTSVP